MVKSSKYLLKFFIIFLISHFIGAEIIIVNSDLDDPAADPATSPMTASNLVTLRSAIEYANIHGSSNIINFNINATGPVLIRIGTGAGVNGDPLPPVSSRLTIDGYSQPGASRAKASTNASGFDMANLLIIINGEAVSNGVFQDGLTLLAGSDSSLIEGLVIQHFPAHGINLQGGSAQKILGNYIGVNQEGTSRASNAGNGINIAAGVNDVIIGSTNLAERNVISGQDSVGNGVGIFNQGTGTQIIGNFIGTDASGTSSIPNITGVYLLSSANVSLGTLIKCNTIQNSNGDEALNGFGVVVNRANNNPILSNTIYNNDKSGIVLVDDGNNDLSAPTLTKAVASGATITVNGTYANAAFPNAAFRIEFFVSSANRDPITEGQKFVGQATIVTDGSGNAVFNNIRLPSNANPGQFVSATATLLNNAKPLETSPYSNNITITQGSMEGSLSFAIYAKYCNRNDLPCASVS